METTNSNYTIETHNLKTEDGYFVTLLRLLKLNCDSDKKTSGEETPTDRIKTESSITEIETCVSKKPVLIVHGFLCSGDEWMLHGEGKALPYMLADEGYDCWMACMRGSRLCPSKPHTSIPRCSRKFWDFSFDELGFDIRAMIDYVLDTTAQKDLYYVGHSLGCTVLFIMVSHNPGYSSKIKAMAALAPAVYGKHLSNLLVKLPLPLFYLMGKSRFLYQRELYRKTVTGYAKFIIPCNPKNEKLGAFVLRKLGKWTQTAAESQLNKEYRIKVAKMLPGPASTKTFCHFIQAYYSGKFRAYDYGRRNNLKHYGQPKPPLYDIQKSKFPVATFTTTEDGLITSEDVKQVSKDLPNVINHFEICGSDFGHADFVIGSDAKELVYNHVVDIFNNFENGKIV